MSVTPTVLVITVTTAGTKAQVSASDLWVSSAYFEAASANSGTIYIGDSTVTSTKYMSARTSGLGLGISWDSSGQGRPGGSEINLKYFYVDASVNGSKCMVTYFQRMGTGT